MLTWVIIMTLQDALASYSEWALDLSISSRRALASQVRAYVRHSGVEDVRNITPQTFSVYRRNAQNEGYSPATINSTCRGVTTILRYLGPPQAGSPHGIGYLDSVPYSGRKMKERRSPKWSPSLTQLSSLYEACGVATWPNRGGIRPQTWWRSFLVTAYNTAFRKADLLRLPWTSVDFDERLITLTANKTGKTHLVPMNGTLERHLRWMWRERVCVFCAPKSNKVFAAQLSLISATAGIPSVTPQAIRRRACTELEKVQTGAGSLLLGHSLKQAVTYESYAQQAEVLGPAMENLPQPEAFAARDSAAQLFLF